MDWGALERNPCRYLNRRRLTKERREPICPPSLKDYRALLDACTGAFRDIVQFLEETGCRQMEAVTLEWDDIDLPSSTATFRRTKTSRPRTIRLRPQTVIMLRARPRQLRASPLVFWHGDGQMYRQFSTAFAKRVQNVASAVKHAGREFRPFRCHDLRHRFAVE